MISSERHVYLRDLKRFGISLSLLIISAYAFSQPVVVTHPSDTSVCVESSASFMVVAVNTSAYQWQENDGVGWYDLTVDFSYIEGQFTPNMIVKDANIGLNNYSYRCVVSDIFDDKDTSNAALLNVYEAPIITHDPLDDRVCKNDFALFSVVALNGTDYQWQEYSGIGWINLEDNSFYSGTQTSDLEIYTTTGMDGFHYRCVVSQISCPDTSDYGILTVDPTPIIYTVIGGGEYCDGSSGVEIGLNDSELGISYDLIHDEVSTGIVVEGTGESLSFGIISNPGIYNIKAYNQFTGCSINMSLNAMVTINPLPEDFPIQGGGEICNGEVGLEIYLLGSQSGVNYDLYHDEVYTGTSVLGTGSTITFGIHNQNGNYAVYATDQNTNCSGQMSGIVEIIVNDIPIAITGPDQEINAGETAQLNGIGNGGSGFYIYNWSPDYLVQIADIQDPFTIALDSSTIFLLNITDNQTGCISQSDTTVVTIADGALGLSLTASTDIICKGSYAQLFALASGGEGDYQYLWTTNSGDFESDIRNPIVHPNNSTWYYLELSDDNQTLVDSLLIEVKNKPEVFHVNGGGDFCQEEIGVNISLNGSEIETVYQLYRDSDFLVEEKLGNGSSIDFGNYLISGNYTSIAYQPETSCVNNMADTAVLILNDRPEADAGDDKLIGPGESAILNGSASNGSGLYSYIWTPSEKLINPNDQNPSTIALTQSTLFNLSVSDNISGCLSNISSTIVFVTGDIPLSVEIINLYSGVCPGESTTLIAMPSGGNTQYSYSWSSNPEGFISSTNEIIVNPLVDTWYIVQVSNDIESVKDSIYIKMLQAPSVFNLSGGGGYCPDEQGVDLYLDESELGTNYSLYYNTSPKGTILIGTGNSLNFGKMISEGDYTVLARAENNCTSLMDNNIEVLKYSKPEKYQLYGGGIYCENDPSLGVLLESSENNVNYDLYRDAVYTGITRSGNGLPISFTQLNGNGIFSVGATNSQTGCFDNMGGAIPLIINESTNISIDGDTELCFGNSTILTASGGASYLWNTYPAQHTPSISVSPDYNTVYKVNSTNLNGCSGFDSIQVNVFEQPEISLENDLFSYSIICSPENLQTYEFYHGEELI